MDSSTKIIIGVVAICSIGSLAHFSGFASASYHADLEGRAKAEISNADLDGVHLKLVEEPSMKRDIILDGNIEHKDAAIELLKNILGVGSVVWDEGSASEEEGALIENSVQRVQKCQNDIDDTMTGKTINFRSGSAYIAANSFPIMDAIVEVLGPCDTIQLEIQGHTDLIGNDEINYSISQARADAVKAMLVERGLKASHITAKGYGASQPIENARTALANQKNRRTVFIVSSDKK